MANEKTPAKTQMALGGPPPPFRKAAASGRAYVSAPTMLAQNATSELIPRLADTLEPDETNPPKPASIVADARALTTVVPLPVQRENRVGTRMAGTDGLSVPGSEAPKLRLVAGALVPGTRYRILRWLGEGGMGVVYEAQHIDIERRVALKILRFDLSRQPNMAQVFRDEARAASRMGSQNIVEIYDFGELADGRLFFCMELLEGGDLVPADQERWTEPAALIPILRQVCKGLLTAHRAGIVHRDIKPENIILVTKNGRAGLVKVVDFGISAMLAAGQTQSGSIAGTPHYMAPEQIMSQAFDGRLDMYALGCTAYELLVGHPPFDADTLEALLHKHLLELPTPPSKVCPDRDIPKAVEAVIMRCLEKDPAKRYADMADLEAALCEAQIEAKINTSWDDLPIPDVETERRERLIREMPSPMPEMDAKKRRWLWPSLAISSFLAVGGLAGYLLFGRAPTEQQRDEIEQLTIAARNAAAKAHYVYPPAKQPEAYTAYHSVIDMENIEGLAARLADARAETLREEFAGTLVGFGDKYWDSEGGKPFAREYYIQSLVFDPTNALALERSGLTLGMLAELRDKAMTGKFSEVELQVSELLGALSEEDEQARQQKLAEAEVPTSLTGQIFLDEYVRGSDGRAGKRRTQAVEPTLPPAAPAPMLPSVTQASRAPAVPVPEDQPQILPESEATTKPSSSARSKAVLVKTKRDPSRAAQLADAGANALTSGRRGDAEQLFNQAIALDQNNARALTGLSDIYFDTGSSQKAVLFAERAVEAAPHHKTYRLKLGDAYFKVLRYKDALSQYEEAHEMGEARAEQRISRVKSKLGG